MTERLDNDRRKAFRQLADLGFRIEHGKGDVKVFAPDGTPFARLSIAGKHARQTPTTMQIRFREWIRKRGRFEKVS